MKYPKNIPEFAGTSSVLWEKSVS